MSRPITILIFLILIMNHNSYATENQDIESLTGPNSPLSSGETIAFFGDSITQSGAQPGGYCKRIADAIRQHKSELGVKVIYAGISGNKVPDLQARLDRDVLSKKPTIVFVYIGINDVWHSQQGKGTPVDVYENGLREIVHKISSAGAKVVLCTPSVIGEKTDGSNPLDDMLEEYSKISRKVANQTNSTLCDLRSEFLAYLKQENSKNESKGILTTDGVHLNAAGNQFVAARAADSMANALRSQSSNTASNSLFNGHDLTGWHADVPKKPSEAGDTFIVRDGKLVSLGSPAGHLITDKSYSDYRLYVEYRFPDKPGNCGVLVHSSTPRALYEMFPQSIEVQMNHQHAGDFWCIVEDITVENMEERRGPKEKWGITEGKARRIVNLTDGSENPLGQWNMMIIECLNDQVKVWVNGFLVNHGTNCTASSGQISLQAEGSEVEFRRLDLVPIQELTK